MKRKYLIQLGVSVLVGAIIAVGLFWVIPNWSRSDMLSLFTLIVAIWQVSITRWETMPKGELARRQLEILKANEKKENTPTIFISSQSYGDNGWVRLVNASEVDAFNIVYSIKPLNGEMAPLVYGPQLPIDKFTPSSECEFKYAKASFIANSYSVKIEYNDVSGVKYVKEQIISM